METGIGCRSELRHSCDPSIQSDPACPAPDLIPGGDTLEPVRSRDLSKPSLASLGAVSRSHLRVYRSAGPGGSHSTRMPFLRQHLPYGSQVFEHFLFSGLGTMLSLSISQAPAADIVPGPSQAT